MLWDVATGKQIAVLRHDGQDPLTSSLFSGDARRIATFYASGAFCVWDQGRRGPRFCRPGSPWYDVDLSRDGRRVLRTAGDSTVEVWDVASGRRTVLRNGGRVSSAQFDRSGEYVVTGADDAIARVWHVRPQRLVSVLRGHTDGVLRARFSPDGTQVVTGSDDGSARLWPARPNTPIDPAWQRADSTAFSPNSRDVLVVQGERRAVWNTETGVIVPLSGGILVTDVGSWPCGRAVGCSPWSRDGRLVAGANAKGGAVVWDTRTGEVKQYGKATETVTTAAFSPDGSLLVVVDGNQRRARIWNVATARPGAVVPRGRAARDFLASAQFVGGSQRILTVDSIGNAQLSDLATGASTLLPGNTLPTAVAATGDGQLIALGTTSGMLRVYSATGAGATAAARSQPGREEPRLRPCGRADRDRWAEGHDDHVGRPYARADAAPRPRRRHHQRDVQSRRQPGARHLRRDDEALGSNAAAGRRRAAADTRRPRRAQPGRKPDRDRRQAASPGCPLRRLCAATRARAARSLAPTRSVISAWRTSL